MDYASGGPLSISTVYTLGRQLVSTNHLVTYIADQGRIQIMKEMHDKGVVHWGIKPNKILLPRSGELRPDLVD